MEQELEQLEGTVEDIIYENTDNGYTVFEVSGGGVMTVVCGVVGELHAGETVICRENPPSVSVSVCRTRLAEGGIIKDKLSGIQRIAAYPNQNSTSVSIPVTSVLSSQRYTFTPYFLFSSSSPRMWILNSFPHISRGTGK